MAARRRGTITSWKDDKGFGFIAPEGGGDGVFFHITNVRKHHARPAANMAVLYTHSHDERQRPRAIDVQLPGGERSQMVLSASVAAIFFGALALATWAIRLSPVALALYALSSVAAYWLYALDKASAVQGARRVPESTLHLIELVGGWPGALVAQQRYHHKTVKASYQTEFWIIVGANLAVLLGYSFIMLLSNR